MTCDVNITIYDVCLYTVERGEATLNVPVHGQLILYILNIKTYAMSKQTLLIRFWYMQHIMFIILGKHSTFWQFCNDVAGYVALFWFSIHVLILGTQSTNGQSYGACQAAVFNKSTTTWWTRGCSKVALRFRQFFKHKNDKFGISYVENSCYIHKAICWNLGLWWQRIKMRM